MSEPSDFKKDLEHLTDLIKDIKFAMLTTVDDDGSLRSRPMALQQEEFGGEIESTLDDLMNRETEPLVARLPRQPGHKEARYIHLLSGESIAESIAKLEESASETSARVTANDRITQLENAVEMLTEEVKTLRQQLEDFKNQFA